MTRSVPGIGGTNRRRRTITIIVIIAGVSLTGLAFLLRSSAAPNPNLTGDLNNDNTVNLTDLSLLITNWNGTSADADINKDGRVNLTDLSLVLSNWNKTVATPPTTPPTTPPPTPAITCDQAGIQKVVNSVTQASIEANLRKLAQDDSKPAPNESISRHISSPGNKIKVDWARQLYVSYGLLDVSQDFSADGKQLTNVVGRLTGTTTPDTIYAAGGHIDSISENQTVLAPGVNDDGTGVVAAMEAAKALKPFQPCLKSTLDFIAFNDEEEAMQGGVAYVNAIKGKTFKGLYNMDMLGLRESGSECTYNYYNNATREQALATRLTNASSKYGIGLATHNESYTLDDQDAWSFWKAGLPGIFVNQCGETDSHYHKTTDVIQFVDLGQVTKAAKMVTAALAELGMQ